MSTSNASKAAPAKASTPGESEKVRYLRRPEAYPEDTQSVCVIETHHAWVFLTDRHAYKMKKPSRHGRFDYSALAARQRLCEAELGLNRRLAARTYQGVVPLACGDGGELQLGGDGCPVEWLVKMRRLPREHMLDVAASRGTVKGEDIDRLMRKLLRFYEAASTCRVGGMRYASRLCRELEATSRELRQAKFGYPAALLRDTVDRQHAYVDSNTALLEERQHDGFVVEAHGDLRPEHVCLIPHSDPEILDCLEFDADLRCLDRVEELAFFGLECRVTGHDWIETECVDWYRSTSGDRVPVHLWNFYAARRATVRAMLSAWHTLDSDEPDGWLEQGDLYLSLARDYLQDQ